MNQHIFQYNDPMGTRHLFLRHHREANSQGFSFYHFRGDPPEKLKLLEDHHVVLMEGINYSKEQLLKCLNTGVAVTCPFIDIREFHEKFELGYDGPPRKLDVSLQQFRMGFIDEEHRELRDAKTDEDQLDACVDLMYVVIGYCYLRGWDVAEAWRRVHAANLKKVRAQSASQSTRGSAYDVIKPQGWAAPKLTDLV